MSIQNESKILTDQRISALRKAIEHRAEWLFFLLDEADKAGADWEKIGRNAIFRCGCFHGVSQFTATAYLRQFAAEFANEDVKKIFEMEIMEISDSRFCVEFNYCPLVSAWLKHTDDEERIAKLCDIAMEGDRGILHEFPAFDFRLDDTIAWGGKVCRIEVTLSDHPHATFPVHLLSCASVTTQRQEPGPAGNRKPRVSIRR